uniref:Homeobox domain protein n=1 Tax=Haemonchus contortus TaxID=6289 RepID=A0A7I4YSL1_HAECO
MTMNSADFEYTDTKPPLSAMGHVVESIGVDTENQGKCRVCSGRISDRYLVRIDSRVFHENCVRCCVCDVQLQEKCFEKDGQLYCSTHYFKDCSPYRCSGCKLGISPTDMVYKLKTGMVFHVDCHACIRCGRPLSPGEQILVDEVAQTVACMHHFYAEQQRGVGTFPTCSTEPSRYDADRLSEFQIKKEVDTFAYNFDSYPFPEFCDDESKFLKRRGPRTTIKQNQLDVLNRIFSSTPKPSKHARAKLALETGLSMRVWFQNRRSKERRLKHLCNYLRHYEQRGLLPPPIQFPTSEGGNSSDAASFTQYLNGIEGQFDEDDEED